MSLRSAFIRGGCWALALGLPVLAIPLLLGWLKPGPLDPRVYTNVMLMPVFAVPIFAFGGFVNFFRALSAQQRDNGSTRVQDAEAPVDQGSRNANS